VANFFSSAGYAAENIHSGMIAYLCDLWNDGTREPLSSFLDHLEVPLDNRGSLRVRPEWEHIDLVVFDTENGTPILAIEMKFDSREKLVAGEPQTIA
jgi:hypothetical protein